MKDQDISDELDEIRFKLKQLNAKLIDKQYRFIYVLTSVNR